MERGFRQVFARRARRPLALLSLPLAFAASAAMAVGPAVPASATIAGSTSVEGFANLPQFPCTSGCTGTFNGTAAGPGAGTDNSGAKYAVGGVGKFTSSYSYSETCVKTGPSLTGKASGTFTSTGLRGRDGNQMVTGSLAGNFSWTRVGLTAIVTISGTTLTFSNGHTASGAGNGNSASVFIPIPPPTCAKPASVKAAVVSSSAESK